MAVKFKVDGLDDIEKMINRLGKLPQKCVNKSAKKGSDIALKDARNNAPFETGELSKGIILKKEKTTKKGKAVYDIRMDPAKNDIFANKSKEGKRSYYPASQEYGYFTKNGRYIPGVHFMRNALVNNASSIEKTMVEVLENEIDKELKK